MTAYKKLFLAFLLFSVTLTACGPTQRRLRMDQAVDRAWEDLQPNTSSQNRNNWQVSRAEKVTGRDVVDQFNLSALAECPIPMPPENQPIRAASEYWFVLVEPVAPVPPTSSPGTPLPDEIPDPEPFLKSVAILIDPFTGQIIARNFNCGE